MKLVNLGEKVQDGLVKALKENALPFGVDLGLVNIRSLRSAASNVKTAEGADLEVTKLRGKTFARVSRVSESTEESTEEETKEVLKLREDYRYQLENMITSGEVKLGDEFIVSPDDPNVIKYCHDTQTAIGRDPVNPEMSLYNRVDVQGKAFIFVFPTEELVALRVVRGRPVMKTKEKLVKIATELEEEEV